MAEPNWIERQRHLLADLTRVLAMRQTGEELDAAFRDGMEAAERDFEQARKEVAGRYAADKEAADKEFAEARARATAECDADHRAIQQEILDTRRRIIQEFAAGRMEAKAEFQEARWTLGAVFEAGRVQAKGVWKAAQERVADYHRHIRALKARADQVADAWRTEDDPDGPPADDPPAKPPQTVGEGIQAAEARLAELTGDVLPRHYRARRVLWLAAAFWLLALSPLTLLTGSFLWPVLAIAGAAAIAFVGKPWLEAATRARVFGAYRPLTLSLARAAILADRHLVQVRKEFRREVARYRKDHAKGVREAHAKYVVRRQAYRRRREQEWARAEEQFRLRWAQTRRRRDEALHQAEEKYHRRQAEVQRRYEADWQRVHDAYYHRLEENKKIHDACWRELTGRWHDGMGRVAADIHRINRDSDQRFPPWDDPGWERWEPPAACPPAVRFGAYEVGLEQIAPLPADERLPLLCPRSFPLPALVPFPQGGSVLLRAEGAGRAAAVAGLQALMLRYLTALPPGKVRFTILDPVGLGQNFAAFMHLADYGENLVASRIWTEQVHIDQRLADLTGHMENVIQKYLRNQYQSIEEYNAQAGEVAEPFRVLVVANFPVNFSVDAARRLVSIASSGARCGVYTLVSVDLKQPVPQGFNLADLEASGALLTWQDDRFGWKDPDFGKFPLRLEEPPPDEFCTRLIQRVGERARDAGRVEVPFAFIAPPADRWWSGDSRKGLRVPIGRAGATKRQYLDLGQGTNHHVLVAGKTGSGKSTLLHALITSLALHYRPEEVELYLVDFKKGVEFKTYAAQELPHARVVAVESEREFGLSVLQRLDAELRLRGDRFRAAGVPNLTAYREADGRESLPRILLVVDEFQEFFVEEDRVAQEAAQLLDRLVRQGRAFGLHVLLGSQTLGGAYSLARSTIDQMAVRIALQCSEADGHIILSDDNSAARLLSRPGEAIYNDANGLVEGNNPFQVVWLPEEDREAYLQKIRELDRGHGPRPQVVFEGNAPADPAKNPLLAGLLRTPGWPAGRRPASAWLGEPMAIKDPTAAVFRPQSGANLLLVGQHDEHALGILAAALVSLAAQHDPAGTAGRPRFTLLDGSPDDSPLAGLLGRMAGTLPHPTRPAGWRDLPAAVADLAAEVDRRLKANETDAPPLYLFIYGLQRFRDLRKPEDDFSFARRGEDKPSPAKQLAAVLREGPAFNVHTLVWCDSLNNLNRCFDRPGLREFEMRVLFQMSATDSSVLIDSPLAGKLGLYRALFHSEDQGRLEKFRPYGLPAEGWLAEVGRQLRVRERIPV